MPFFRFDPIITKIYDILRQNSLTMGITWLDGRATLADAMAHTPHCSVFQGSWSAKPFTMPVGEEATIRVILELIYASHEGAPTAEKALRLGMDDVAKVLYDSQDLGLSYAYPEGIAGDISINPEGVPPHAIARILLDVKSIPGD